MPQAKPKPRINVQNVGYYADRFLAQAIEKAITTSYPDAAKRTDIARDLVDAFDSGTFHNAVSSNAGQFRAQYKVSGEETRMLHYIERAHKIISDMYNTTPYDKAIRGPGHARQIATEVSNKAFEAAIKDIERVEFPLYGVREEIANTMHAGKMLATATRTFKDEKAAEEWAKEVVHLDRLNLDGIPRGRS